MSGCGCLGCGKTDKEGKGFWQKFGRVRLNSVIPDFEGRVRTWKTNGELQGSVRALGTGPWGPGLGDRSGASQKRFGSAVREEHHSVRTL